MRRTSVRIVRQLHLKAQHSKLTNDFFAPLFDLPLTNFPDKLFSQISLNRFQIVCSLQVFKLGYDISDFEALSNVLKNPIRRRIILFLSDKEKMSYVDLMNSLEITNTGKFNYHLKILGDLIEKDENGQYGLSEKGRLAIAFLQKFDSDKKLETVFRTRAFSLFAGFMWQMLLYPFIGLLFGWHLYFSDPVLATNGNLTIPLISLSLFIVPGFVLMGLNSFPIIEVDRDSIVLRWTTGRRFFIMEEAKADTRGHILRLPFGWFIPFNEEELFGVLDKKVQTYRSKPIYLAFAISPTLLALLFATARRLEGFFPPELWAIMWGVTNALSLAMILYSVPAEIRLGNLNRGKSVVVYSLLAGLTIGISVFLSLVY